MNLEDKNYKFAIKIMVFLVCMLVLNKITAILIEICIKNDDAQTISNILVFAMILMMIPLAVGITIFTVNNGRGKALIKESMMAVCYVFGAGIIIGILPILVEHNIKSDEKINYDKKLIIQETISNYERKLIIEETEKALLDNDYKSKFIKDNDSNIENVKKKIENDVIKKINTEK